MIDEKPRDPPELLGQGRRLDERLQLSGDRGGGIECGPARRAVSPRLQKRQAFRTAKIPSLAQHTVECADHLTLDPVEDELRSPQQPDDRVAGEVGFHEVEHQVDGCGHGFGRERERRARLPGEPARAKRARREVQVRERALEHHRDALVHRWVHGAN